MTQTEHNPIPPIPVPREVEAGRLVLSSMHVRVPDELQMSAFNVACQYPTLPEAADAFGIRLSAFKAMSTAAVDSLGARTAAEASRIAIELGLQPAKFRPEGKDVYLSKRELQTADLLTRGAPLGWIAKHMWLSENTVDKANSSAFRKLGISSQRLIAQAAFEHGVFPPVTDEMARSAYARIVNAGRIRSLLRLAYPAQRTNQISDQALPAILHDILADNVPQSDLEDVLSDTVPPLAKERMASRLAESVSWPKVAHLAEQAKAGGQAKA